MIDRIQVLKPSVSLTSTPIQTDETDIEGWGQLSIEVFPGSLVGTLRISIELSTDGDSWIQESVDDSAAGSLVSGALLIPIYGLTRTFDGTHNVPIQIPVAGYKKVRLQVSAGTSGSATIYVTRMRLASR